MTTLDPEGADTVQPDPFDDYLGEQAPVLPDDGPHPLATLAADVALGFAIALGLIVTVLAVSRAWPW